MAVVRYHNLEALVVPFQVNPWLSKFPKSTPPVVLPPVGALDSSAVASEQSEFMGLEWGAPNDSQFTSVGISGVKTTNDSDQTETARETSKKKITNPDDDSQFVEVDIINAITFFDAKANQYVKQTLNNG